MATYGQGFSRALTLKSFPCQFTAFVSRNYVSGSQKSCIRILLGDREAYLEKFNTCCRTRSIETQKLGVEFYKREHTKPIFHKTGILAYQNLYNYHIIYV